jgi:hypothetical protein
MMELNGSNSHYTIQWNLTAPIQIIQYEELNSSIKSIQMVRFKGDYLKVIFFIPTAGILKNSHHINPKGVLF